MRLRKRFIGFIVVVQLILSLGHYFLYKTWTFRHDFGSPPENLWLGVILGTLSVSFVAASILAFSYTGAPVRAFYKVSAVWMGVLSFLFLAAALAWVVFAVATVAGAALNFHRVVQ